MMGRAGRKACAGKAVVIVRPKDVWAAGELVKELQEEKIPAFASYLEKAACVTKPWESVQKIDIVPIATNVAAYLARQTENGRSKIWKASMNGGETIICGYWPTLPKYWMSGAFIIIICGRIEELVEIAENAASSPVYALLKREDEKFVTEKAYETPVFVEDLVRNVAVALKSDSRIAWYRVESENFESIHNHSAYAMVESE